MWLLLFKVLTILVRPGPETLAYDHNCRPAWFRLISKQHRCRTKNPCLKFSVLSSAQPRIYYLIEIINIMPTTVMDFSQLLQYCL